MSLDIHLQRVTNWIKRTNLAVALELGLRALIWISSQAEWAIHAECGNWGWSGEWTTTPGDPACPHPSHPTGIKQKQRKQTNKRERSDKNIYVQRNSKRRDAMPVPSIMPDARRYATTLPAGRLLLPVPLSLPLNWPTGGSSKRFRKIYASQKRSVNIAREVGGTNGAEGGRRYRSRTGQA